MTDIANIFEQASRAKLRFNTDVGNLSAEDLWDLPLTTSTRRVNLDSLAIELNEALEKGKGKSFVNNVKKDEILQLKFDIVKHIIDTRVAESEAKTVAKKRESERSKIDDLIAKKEDDELLNLPLEELKKRRESL